MKLIWDFWKVGWVLNMWRARRNGMHSLQGCTRRRSRYYWLISLCRAASGRVAVSIVKIIFRGTLNSKRRWFPRRSRRNITTIVHIRLLRLRCSSVLLKVHIPRTQYSNSSKKSLIPFPSYNNIPGRSERGIAPTNRNGS